MHFLFKPEKSLYISLYLSPHTHFISTTFPFPSLLFILNLSSCVKLKVGFAFLTKMTRNLDDNPLSSNNLPPLLKLLDCSLRLCVIPLSVATIWLTVTNKQDNSTYGKVEFSNLLGLKYMVCVSAICSGYALVAAVSSWIRRLVTKAWFFFVSDQIVAYLMVTSGAAVLEILYLAYNGDQEVTWSEACSSYGKFCNKMKLALVFHVLALGCFIVLAVISAYRVFSMFEPPVSSKEVEEERA